MVAKVNTIDNSEFVLKTKHDTNKSELENKIPDTDGLVEKTDYDAKTAEIKGKIPDISNLATETALTTVEDKILDVSSLVKKTDYNTRLSEIDTKVSSLDGKITENKTKNESIENKIKKGFFFCFFFMQLYSLIGGDGSQAYLIFNHYIDMLELLLILNTFLNGNLKECLMKILNLLHLITVLLH